MGAVLCAHAGHTEAHRFQTRGMKMAQYEAGSIEDIAEMFERFAASAMSQAKHATTQKAAQFEMGRASAWTDAAQMLRKTKLTQPAA